MQIGEKHINTPYDGRIIIDPIWRYLVARSWADDRMWTPDIKEVADDPWVLNLKFYFIQSSKSEKAVADELRAYRHALAWYTSGDLTNIRAKIDALLLTNATFESMSIDLSSGRIPASTFQLYERLFFNIRDDDGLLDKSSELRSQFALGDLRGVQDNTPDDIIWKVAAFRVGYAGVAALWGWKDGAGSHSEDPRVVERAIWTESQGLVLDRVLRKQVNSFDLAGFLGQYINNERMRRETPSDDPQEDRNEFAIAGMLGVAAPHIIEAAKSVDEAEALTADIQARIRAQKSVSDQTVADRGASVGFDSVNDTLSQHFADQPK